MDTKIKQDISLGNNIRNLRIKSQLTQKEVAARLQLLDIDISRDFYAHIENGTYNIRVSELIALKKIFNANYNDFFEGLEIE